MTREAQRELATLWRNRARNLNERARMFQAEGHLHPQDLREIVKRDGSRCVYCDRALDYTRRGASRDTDASLDHIIRLCDGGSNTYENVVCACRGCNQRNASRSQADPQGAAIERLRWYLARKPNGAAA